MIYHVALSLDNRVIVLEADSFYVDEGMIIFNTENDHIGVRRLATFHAANVLWVAADTVVHNVDTHPRRDLIPFPIVNDIQREEDRARLMYAPAILSATSSYRENGVYPDPERDVQMDASPTRSTWGEAMPAATPVPTREWFTHAASTGESLR